MKAWRVPYPKFGDGPGLARVTAVAARLGIDLTQFGETGAVIVGSNGKGSTAAMTASLLAQTGESVGLFTSPHLFDLNERFRIRGEDISDQELDRHWRRIVEAIEQAKLADRIGGFEFLFLIAADWFAARHCAYTVWEAGIGGRLDPVRLIAARRLALTSLDLEHTALLGNSLGAIAREKIAAAPRGSKLFVSDSTTVRHELENICNEYSVELEFVSPAAEAPLVGAHQRANAALAINLACHTAPLSGAQIQAGLGATRWPGRLEVIEMEPLLVIDVGHTPDAIRFALEGFKGLRGERRGVLVCGVSEDKNVAGIVSALAPSFASIICVAAHHNGAPPAQIAAAAADANPTAEITIAESVTDSRRLAFAKVKPAETAIYVAGSLFLAAEFKAAHQGRDPASLAFF